MRRLRRRSVPVLANSSRAEAEQRRRIQRFVRWMDTGFRIPGTPIRFGLDGLIGLVPGVGDVVTTIASGWLIREAIRAQVPPSILLKMLGNVSADFVLGLVPVVGDALDVYWKANLRNSRLLERHIEQRRVQLRNTDDRQL